MCHNRSMNTLHAPAILCAAFALAVLSLCAPFACVDCAWAKTETVAVLADTHLGLPDQPSYEETENALAWASELPQLKAVVVAGDLTDRGDPISYSEWEYLYESIIGGQLPAVALGDHDTGKNGIYLGANRTLTVANGLRYFKDINGGTITTFRKYENFNIMTVGGIRARGHSVITPSMLQELDARLKSTVRSGKIAVVVCHYPYNSGALNMRLRFMGVLRSYPNVIYVSGHRHRYTGASRCHSVAPACATTAYSRAGHKKPVKFAFTSVGVNACSSYRSRDYSYADTLNVTDAGRVRVEKWNLSKGKIDRIWSFKQVKSSIAVQLPAKAAQLAEQGDFTCEVTFSDGGTYSGMRSGSSFKLSANTSKTFSNIPAGVLVTVQVTDAPAPWTTQGVKSLEVSDSPQILYAKTTQEDTTVNVQSKKAKAKTPSKLKSASSN